MQPWTGRTIFVVDKDHIDRCGTDQRRQRIEAANLNSEKGQLDMLRWSELNMKCEEQDEDRQKRPGAEKAPENPGV